MSKERVHDMFISYGFILGHTFTLTKKHACIWIEVFSFDIVNILVILV